MLATNIIDQIRRDVASFADPGTDVEISERSLSWVRSRTSFTAQLVRRADGFPDVLWDRREYGYASFLASEALADLKDLAATICATTSPPSHYVPVPARKDVMEPSEDVDAAALLLKETSLASLPIAATRIVFVHGNAGTGKTSTLLQVTRTQAERYLQGQTGQLLLYLDAQGKGLNQLEDVMARALQDLRAKFTYHSVAALARRLCIVPIVDGFDELIGPSSAREAFANLSQFLAQLDCEGALIASSRSAFIDYGTLHERAREIATSQNLSYEILPVEILGWGEGSIKSYCDSRGPDKWASVSELMASPVRDLLRKPFFLSKVCDLLAEGTAIDVQADVTRQVVDAALAREASKLRDSRGIDLLTVEQHRELCEALADEMWSLSRPDLDGEAIRLLAEMMAEQFRLSPRDTKTLVDRSMAHGLLTLVPGRKSDRRAFEHELFRFEFQASRLARLLGERSQAARDYVRRAELPIEVVSRIDHYGLGSVSVAGILAELCQVVASAPNNQYSATNAGSIAWALLHGREDIPDGVRMVGFYLRAHDFGRCRLRGAVVQRCLLEGVSLREAALVDCDIEDTQFIRCTFGAGTRLTGTKLDPHLFAGIVEAGGAELYDPSAIRARLLAAEATLPPQPEPAAPEVPPEVRARIAVIERFLTHARTHYYLSRSENWFRNNLEDDPAWPEVEQRLRDHGLAEDVVLTKSGPAEKFLRLTLAPDRILQARSGAAGAASAASRFWRVVLAE